MVFILRLCGFYNHSMEKCISRVIFITQNNKDNFCYFYSLTSAKTIVNIMEMQRFHFF